MTFFHVHHQFHSAGHGTFFTGLIVNDHNQNEIFRWAYDCGSKRSTRLSDLIANLSSVKHWQCNELDLLAISHFDDDHICGLETLLNAYRVKWLALPYMSFKSRLFHASLSSDEDSASSETALFSIDPILYLRTRGLAKRVEGIMLIRGGEDDRAGDGFEPLPDPSDPDAFTTSYRVGPSERTEYETDAVTNGSSDRPKLFIRPHGVPVRPDFPIEFVFFNKSLKDSQAKRSKKDIKEVQQEVHEILKRHRLLDPSLKPRKGWRDRLRDCYRKHFGYSELGRNDISLCVFVRPIVKSDMGQCLYFRSPCLDDEQLCEFLLQDGKQGLLLTGDIALDRDSINKIISHFGSWRWDKLGVAQVPHHGSRHSWKNGNAIQFKGAEFIQCIPTISTNGHHPHTTVLADLAPFNVFNADYEHSVVQRYHFEG